MKIETFVLRYLEAILFGELDDSEEGAPLDENFTIFDFSEDAREKACADCEEFLARASIRGFDVLSWNYDKAEQAAFDFYFSRQGHGTGFFDRPELYGEDRHALQEIAKGMGERCWYVSSNGKIEQD